MPISMHNGPMPQFEPMRQPCALANRIPISSQTWVSCTDSCILQCRLNEGIVFFYDLKLKAEAIQSWKEALRLNNEIRMSNGELLSALVERLEKEH